MELFGLNNYTLNTNTKSFIESHKWKEPIDLIKRENCLKATNLGTTKFTDTPQNTYLRKIKLSNKGYATCIYSKTEGSKENPLRLGREITKFS